MMTNRLAGQLGGVPYKYFGDWTDRVAKGELPKHKPAAAVRRRAQRRRDHLGLVDAGQVPARPDLVRPAQADGQRRRPALRRAGVFDRQHAGPRSEDPQGVVLQDAGGRSEHAALAWTGPRRRDQADDGLGLLGRRSPLGHQGEPAQRHVRRQGPGLARRERARHGQSGLVQEGLGASVRQGVPDRSLVASGRDARSQDAEIRVHRHLLRHASSAVRLRRRQYAVDVRLRAGGGLGQHQGVGRDQGLRRRRSAGSRSCSTPTATASSTSSPSRASRRRARTRASIRARVPTR